MKISLNTFKNFSIEKNELEEVFINFLNIKRHELITKSFFDIEKKNFVKLKKILTEISKKKPLSQVFGFKNFLDSKVFVTRKTLVPRPETELLVQKVVDDHKNEEDKSDLSFLDIGTGSGVIAIEIAKKFPESKIFASDKSKEALLIAKKNSKIQKAKNIKFIKTDLLKSFLKKGYIPKIIVANLPYVPKYEYCSLEKNIYFEPRNAILAGKDGMKSIKKLLKQIFYGTEKLRWRNLEIYLEIHDKGAKKIKSLLTKNYPKNTNLNLEIFKDFSMKDRIVKITV